MEEVPKTCRPPLQELLAAELRLDPRQWGAAPRRHATAKEDVAGSGEAAAAARGSEALLEVDCLVSLGSRGGKWARIAAASVGG